MPSPYVFEWWITYVLPIVTAAVLTATLIGTVVLARAALRQAEHAGRQADSALAASRLAAFVQVRPLVSVTVVGATWEAGALKNLAFTVENAGQGAASNVQVTLSGYVDAWRVSAIAGEGVIGSGAMQYGASRKYVAECVRSGRETGFEQSVVFQIECFDVMARHFCFEQEFVIGHEVQRLQDVGLRITESPNE